MNCESFLLIQPTISFFWQVLETCIAWIWEQGKSVEEELAMVKCKSEVAKLKRAGVEVDWS